MKSLSVYIKTLYLCIFCFSLLYPGKILAFQNDSTIVYDEVRLIDVIHDIQLNSSYYFLYRESQVSNIKVNLVSTDDELLTDLSQYLKDFLLDMQVDTIRKQILLVKLVPDNNQSQRIEISGQVVDSKTGERLPFATISWLEGQNLRGIISNANGSFLIQKNINQDYFLVNVSYIGYQRKSIQIDVSQTQISDLTIRLNSATLRGRDIIISDYMGYNPMDTLLTGMIDAGRFSPLGESNSIRALQSHPSVSNGTALNQGIHVRGSSPDGFTVLLDGMSIFNQTHLFGLLDSFNDDAIQSAGYFFDVTPAHIESATGGTLNLMTRTGSRNEFKRHIGLSNSSLNATLEGPIGSQSSWLLSARTSFIDQIGWFNNSSLIQWGLDVDRPKRITSDERDFTKLVLRSGDSNAHFVDFHGKIYFESKNSDRFTLSTYYGGDSASHVAERRTRRASTQGDFIFLPVKTSNDWGNALASLSYDKNFTNSIFSKTTIGFSAYKTDFSKDDFVYSRISELNGNKTVTIFTYPFRNRSTMNEFKLNQEFNYNRADWKLIGGGSIKSYNGAYSEFSFDRSSFFLRSGAFLADLYVQTDYTPWEWVLIQTGLRVYKYSLKKTIDYAPRFKTRVTLTPGLHISAGYTVNHQYLHKISIENATTADVWILTTKDQPSASSNQLSTGFEFSPAGSFYFKAEVYEKKFQNIRVHELNERSFENTISGTPWIFGNSGTARGIELLLRNKWNLFTITQSYTLSKMVFRNPFLLNGESFFADWDRTHSYNTVFEALVTKKLKFNLNWILMSGVPNSIDITRAEVQTRLDDYQRLDVSGSWRTNLTSSTNLEIKLSVYNVLNRKNVWYRNYSFNFDETRSIPLLRPVSVDVLDLGFQPSFSIKLTF